MIRQVRKLVIGWVLGLFVASGGWAQRVLVYDESTLQPLEGVRLEAWKRFADGQLRTGSATTNAEGYANLPHLQDYDSVRFMAPAYAPRVLSPFEVDVARFRVWLRAHATDLEETVIVADRVGEPRREAPGQFQVISGQSIQLQNSPTPAHALEQHGQVFVQRSQLAGGSPVLRGLEANRLLLVVDGLRLNNAIFRSGHLQNVLGVDANLLEALEVQHGPGGVLYGADALGGVIHLRTRQPLYSTEAKPVVQTQALLRYASAADELTLHADVNLGWRRVASLTSLTMSTYGDLRMGRWQSPLWGDFGRRRFYQGRTPDGLRDTMLPNPDPLVQRASGYSQLDVVQKLAFRSKSGQTKHLLNLQLSAMGESPRYDRLTDTTASGVFRSAEWSYGPQTRLQGAYHVSVQRWRRSLGVFRLDAAVQQFQESRLTRGWNRPLTTTRTEQVQVVTLTALFEKRLGPTVGETDPVGIRSVHKFYYGLDGQLNTVRSRAWNDSVVGGGRSPNEPLTRYPDGGSQQHWGALFFRHEWELARGRLKLESGLRYTLAVLETRFRNTAWHPALPARQTVTNSAPSGALALLGNVARKVQVLGTLSTGFRTPNVDDAGKVFDSSPGAVVVPNPGLRPEYTVTGEVGIRALEQPGLPFRAEGYVFYTHVQDFLQVRPYTGLGTDTLTYDGTASQVLALQNVQRGRIWGVSANVEASIGPRFVFRQTLTFTEGTDLTDNVPLDHIPPVFGLSALEYRRARLVGVFQAQYNGWKRIADYAPNGEDNPQYALPQGIPAWFTLNLKLQYALSRSVRLSLGCENLLDAHYRTFMSGISASGRNIVGSLRATF